MRLLAPASEWGAIDSHIETIRKIEMQLSEQIANGGGTNEGCVLPPEPDESLKGETGSKYDYDDPASNDSDEEVHELVGKTHMSIIRAAFQCDIIRVATFQWSPGTNHVSFAGLDPNNPEQIYMHHPLSHKMGDPAFYNGSPPGGSTLRCMVVLGDTRHPSSRRARLSETWRRRTGLPLMEMVDPSLIDALSPSANCPTACDMLELPLETSIISLKPG